MTFNLLPAGTFTMGSPDDEPGGPYDHETQHQVTLSKSFHMQTTEVTNKQWNAVIVAKGRGINPSVSHSGDNYPVENVNWYEAASFANWLSADQGLIPCYNGNSTCSGTLGSGFTCTNVTMVSGCTGYRLPTEAQWEYGARATTTTAWPYAESYDTSLNPGQVTGTGFNSNLDAMGWYTFSNTTQYGTGTKPVARKQANKWGLYDMQGNVSEWCQDRWDGHSDYSPDPVTDPTGTGDSTVSSRVNRGGCWADYARNVRSAYRYGNTPDSRFVALGFRLVLAQGQ
jgi:formylglycine-generating enzyme required for sulfatase activity